MKTTPIRTLTAGVIASCVLGLSACGGSGDEGDQASDSETTASTPAEGPRPGGAMDEETLQQVRECLEAAGLDSALPSDGVPSGMPSDMPSDFPTDMPTDMPSDFPTEMPSGAAGGGMFNDPEVQEALEACGISLPSPGGSEVEQ